VHRRPHLTRRAGPLAVGLAVAAGLLAGCSGASSSVAPAPQATSAACTGLLTRLPAGVADQIRVTDPAPGAAAWGDPRILLRCGLPPSPPTTTPCIEVNGVDWLFDETGDGFRLTTYGRRPAVQLDVPAGYGRSKANAAMVDLAPAVQALPVERRCT
jgi:hypothetical protein